MAPRARLTPPPFTQGNSLLYLFYLFGQSLITSFAKKYSSAKIFPGGSVVKNLTVDAGDVGLLPGLGRPSGEGNGNQLQFSSCKIPWTEESGLLESMGCKELHMTD